MHALVEFRIQIVQTAYPSQARDGQFILMTLDSAELFAYGECAPSLSKVISITLPLT